MEFMRKLGKQLALVWNGMSAGRRMALVATTVFSVGVVVAVWYWASQTDYAVLYSGLAPEDAGAITSKLQAQGISYRLTNGGTTVLVPADQVYQKRIEMAVEGLPTKGGKGFELFDSSPLGMTPFTQHVNYLRALQSELAKTIGQIDPIVSARVHLVRPDPSPFIRDQKPTTASVMLRLRPGAMLTRNVSSGIVAFVSRSVEGLTPENVTLVDANGRLLSDPHANESGSITTQMDYRKEIELYLASKAEDMLAQVLGPGRAIVRVTADINFQRVKEYRETYNPDGRVVKSEVVTSAKATGAGPGPRGAAGTSSNLAKQPPGPSAAGNGGSNNEETTKTEYAIDRTTKESEDKIGAIERLTVAAMIDLSADNAKGAGGVPAFSMSEAQDLIKKAVGFKTNRGDEIKVSNVKLSTPVLPPNTENEADGLAGWQSTLSLVRNGSLGLAALVAFILGWMVVRRLRVVPVPATGAATEAAAGASAPRVPSALEQNPEAIAKILASWLDQSDRPRKAAA